MQSCHDTETLHPTRRTLDNSERFNYHIRVVDICKALGRRQEVFKISGVGSGRGRKFSKI